MKSLQIIRSILVLVLLHLHNCSLYWDVIVISTIEPPDNDRVGAVYFLLMPQYREDIYRDGKTAIWPPECPFGVHTQRTPPPPDDAGTACGPEGGRNGGNKMYRGPMKPKPNSSIENGYDVRSRRGK